MTTSGPETGNGGETPSFADAVLAPFRDAWLAGRTRLVLLGALGGDAGEISVEAYRNNVALNGEVATRAAREAAERVVRGLPGVIGVSNRLRVRGAECPRPGGTDAEIRAAVAACLREARALRGSIVTVENVYDGVVRLIGVGRDASVVASAFELVVAVPGVRRVINDVVPYHSPAADDDADAA